VATRFCMVVPNTLFVDPQCGTDLMLPKSKFEVALTFLESLCTPLLDEKYICVLTSHSKYVKKFNMEKLI